MTSPQCSAGYGSGERAARTRRVFSTYAADTPQIYLDIDRDKAQVLGLKISDIFNALQSTLGSYYVNDFNVFGRTWQVNVQAETQFRDNVADIDQIYVRNADGGMVPLRALAVAKLVQGPQSVIRYNGFRGAVVNGAPKPGYSSGQALAAMERMSAATLPAGYSYEWTATAFRRRRRRGRTDGLRTRPSYSLRLSVSGCALRKLEHSPFSLAGGQRRDTRRSRRSVTGWIKLRRICADRSRGPDRAVRQERHFDRCVCGGAAAAREGYQRRRH